MEGFKLNKQKVDGDRVIRIDIQALRALAVGIVVVYHLWPEQLPGGFVGVDVFFVISGFLITQHLYSEIERTGTVSLSRFWARRIRRLLPAAFLVLFASVLMLLFLMPRAVWQANLQEIAAAAVYGQNWLLAVNAVDYLGAENSPSLVQHYWSLSVEEQFYIVWPLLLLLGLFGARRFRSSNIRQWVLAVLVVVAGVSLALSITQTAQSPAFAFFATQTRAWEFALGGVVALVSLDSLLSKMRVVRTVAPWLGIMIIVGCAFLMGSDSAFPGWVALIPVCGALLVLISGDAQARWSPARLFGWRPIQWVGDYSYPIYLWHWPLIVLAPWLMHSELSPSSKFVILGATVLLAYGTKRLLEDPIRASRALGRKRWPSYSFAAAGMAVVMIASAVFYQDVERSTALSKAQAATALAKSEACFGASAMLSSSDCDDPFAVPDDLDAAFARTDTGVPNSCQQTSDERTVSFCEFGEVSVPAGTIVVVGNSHAHRMTPALAGFGEEQGYRVLLASKTGCLGASVTAVGVQTADDPCVAWSMNLQQQLLDMADLEAVIYVSHVGAQTYIAGEDPTPEALSAAEASVTANWAALAQHGVRPVVMEDVPGMRPDSGPECVSQSTVVTAPCALERESVVRPNLLTEIAQNHPDLASYVEVNDYLCDGEECHALIGGVIVYSDSHHITATFSRSLVGPLTPALVAALAE